MFAGLNGKKYSCAGWIEYQRYREGHVSSVQRTKLVTPDQARGVFKVAQTDGAIQITIESAACF